MDDIDTNHVNMIRSTTTFCDENPLASASIPAFLPALNSAKAKLLLVDQLDQIASGTTTGVTLDTKAIRKVMTDMAIKCASAVFAYASSINNNTLKAQVNYTANKLEKLKKEEVDDVCETIHDVTNTNIANAQNFGTSPADVTNLQTAINLYRNASSNPRQARISISDAKSQIKNLIKEIIQLNFKSLMDKMMITLKAVNNNYVNQYFLNREIIDLGSTHTKIRGTVSAPNGTFLQGAVVILKLTGQPAIAYQTTVDNQGKYGISPVVPSDYDLFVSLAGYQPFTEISIHFSPGKELKRDITLIPV